MSTPFPFGAARLVNRSASPDLIWTGAKLTDIDKRRSVVRYKVSDETLDRDGERIMLDGWVLDEYQKNPQFLWLHDSWFLPVGIGEKDSAEVIAGDGLYNSVRLALDVPGAAGAAYDFIRTISAFILDARLPATSVGMEPMAWTDEDGTKNERARGGAWPGKKKGRVWTKQIMWEHSSVPIPANPQAVQAMPQNAEEKLKAVEESYRRLVSDIENGTAHLALGGGPPQDWIRDILTVPLAPKEPDPSKGPDPPEADAMDSFLTLTADEIETHKRAAGADPLSFLVT